MTSAQLQAAFQAQGLPAYRAKQVFSWLHQHGLTTFEQMHNLPKSLRLQLHQQYEILSCRIARKQVSQFDGTVKYLFALYDGQTVESVFMQHNYGNTLCISTQVGCRMGCTFCASTKGGCVRNLSASEMLSQIHAVQADLRVRISHIVLMGMGEPLDNYDNTLRFISLVNTADGLSIGMRNLTLSTCGIVPRIFDLMRENLQLTLSVSLHAPNDALRTRMMPINRRYPLCELLDACRQYAKETSRRISFEYTLLQDVNDSTACAEELAGLLHGMLCHVNLIPLNATTQRLQPTQPAQLALFQRILEQYGIPVTVRKSLGADIDAACGQLRRQQKS